MGVCAYLREREKACGGLNTKEKAEATTPLFEAKKQQNRRGSRSPLREDMRKEKNRGTKLRKGAEEMRMKVEEEEETHVMGEKDTGESYLLVSLIC